MWSPSVKFEPMRNRLPLQSLRHLRSLTIGHEVIVPITAGRLDFGPWQRVFYGEWYGQRRKRLIIKVLGE